MEKNLIICIDEETNNQKKSIIRYLEEHVNNEGFEILYIITDNDYRFNIPSDLYSKVKYIQIIEVDTTLQKEYITEFLEKKLENKINEESILDLTYASKTLTVILTIIATRNNLSLKGFDDTTKTKLSTHNLDKSNQYNDIIRLFNKYKYKQALIALHNSTLETKDKQALEKIIKYYRSFDNYKFYIPNNITQLIQQSYLESIKKQLNDNIYASKQFKKKNFTAYSYKIANHISNAKRRMEEGNYQRAILRLYNALETIALTRLKSYGIDKYYFSQEQLEEYDIPYNYIRSISDMDQLSVDKQFKLLSLLDDNIGKLFIIYKNKGYNIIHTHIQCISNDYHISGEDMEIYYNIACRLAFELNPEIKKYIKQTQFPKLELKRR